MTIKTRISRILMGCLLSAQFPGTILADDFDLKIEGAVNVSFQAQAGRIYQIESSQDIPSPVWTIEGKTIQGAGARHEATFLTGQTGKRIYRIQELILTNGLVLFYPFNGDAKDESGRANDGILHGVTLGTNRFGVAGNSYNFTATGLYPTWIGDYVSTTHANGFPIGKEDFTISLWAKLSQYGPDYHIFFANQENNMFQLGLSVFSGNKAAIEYYSGFGRIAPDVTSSPLDWSLDTWYNVQITSSANLVTIFRDGIFLIQQVASETSGNTASPENLILDIGWRSKPGAGNHPFWGSLDDFRIFNRALSMAELKALNEIVE
jgi:hypothetical protein